MMNGIILAARLLFVLFAIVLLTGAVLVSFNYAEMNGTNALTVVLSAAAAVGVISSWNPRTKQ